MPSNIKKIKDFFIEDENSDILTIWSWIDIYYSRYIKDPYYWIKNRLFHRYDLIPTGRNKGSWHDKVELMLYGNMEMLVDFVEGEEWFGDDDDHSRAGNEIKAIYAWWKNYPNRLKERDTAADAWHTAKFTDPTVDWLDALNTPSTPEVNKLFEQIRILEVKLYEEEAEYLKRLMDIRRFLWT